MARCGVPTVMSMSTKRDGELTLEVPDLLQELDHDRRDLRHAALHELHGLLGHGLQERLHLRVVGELPDRGRFDPRAPTCDVLDAEERQRRGGDARLELEGPLASACAGRRPRAKQQEGGYEKPGQMSSLA